ncbi:hypothetical protein [Rhizobium sp. Leaf306]|uniref:hypothetical protein n=1 Tax=Rhizobium sp. Leaf306 TaxID=1736330 RepID=UPI0012E881D9|nr:hypothetical protein [Rhizobium sp. Leaf306]
MIGGKLQYSADPDIVFSPDQYDIHIAACCDGAVLGSNYVKANHGLMLRFVVVETAQGLFVAYAEKHDLLAPEVPGCLSIKGTHSRSHDKGQLT